MLTDERRSAIIDEFSVPIGEVGGFTIHAVVGQYRVNQFARAIEREARREALEEAAKVCDALVDESPLDDFCVGANARSHTCAAAIRVLIDKEPRT